jgi:formamidopyrimidine-DNA glycosylase
MPEGPEVFLLSFHLKKLGFNCFSYGKHLYLYQEEGGDKLRDISFGLYGRVYYSNKKLDKITSGPICGDDKIIDSSASLGFGPDFMNMSKEDIENFVHDKIKNSRRQLATFLLDQDEIAGLGVAWISEIAHLAGITDTDLSSKCNCLDELKRFKLIDAMFQIQTIVKHIILDQVKDLDSESFVNEWFENLYRIRTPFINVYRKGRPVLIGSRQFWVI